MSSEEVASGEEYEVESIRQAKVVRGRQGRKDWSYLVKWKNYSNEDNTWEPPESFTGGSEHFISEFWLRVNTGARDWQDFSKFKLGDELFPTGPPRLRSKTTPKKPRESAKASSPSTMEPSDESEDEVNSIIGDDDRPKRKRRSSDVLESASLKRRRGRKSEVQEEDLHTRAHSSLRRKRSMPQMTSATATRNTASGSASRRKPTSARKSPSRSPALAYRRGKREFDEDSTPDEILLQPTPKSRPRKTKRTLTDVAVEQEIELELQYPSDPSSLGGSTAGAQEPAMSDPSVFGIPILLTERAELPQPASATAELTASVPPHRSRKARVQRYEDTLLGAGEGSGIPAKAKFMQQNGTGFGSQSALQADVSPSTGPIRRSTRPRVPSAKAGPGRSSSGMVTGSTSLLTATKGALRTIKGKVFPARRARANEQGQESGDGDELSAAVDGSKREPEVVEQLPPPPTGQELLRQAGYNAADAQNLSDFENDIDAHGEPDPDHPQPPHEAVNEQSNTVVAEQIAANVQEDAKGETVTDAAQASSQGDTIAGVHSTAPEVAPERSFQGWRVSTIFGPFHSGIGKEAMPAKQEEQAEDTANASPIEESANHLFLSLDYTTSVPVRLKDTYPPGSQLEHQAFQSNPGPPGKFYKNEHVPAVLQTLRTEGSTARLVLDGAADESHREHFARFCSRLHAGELFVELTGVKLFAMFSSENRALGERLSPPANLLGLSDTVLVAQVAIENHSGYADVVAYADNTQWSAA
ncbi:hypothetical protein DAEQUDRAFT_725756 [Daedalea quercina L-15889]|uniref:Chromo domain-containing protein n=1 Tax=Daedalea quercina L-15889 TaxID=1314783 RepID=A0A165R007_9APHY|nr:hypothetical protein DAEQUDRAFT_725756 [Daedalea quercina L-15889]